MVGGNSDYTTAAVKFGKGNYATTVANTDGIADTTQTSSASHREPLPFRVKTADIRMAGNSPFISSDGTKSATMNTSKYWVEGDNMRLNGEDIKSYYPSDNANVIDPTIADIDVGVDSDGYLSTVTVNDSGYYPWDFAGGRDDGGDTMTAINNMFVYEINATAVTPATVTASEDEDNMVNIGLDYWNDTDYNENRTWPSHVRPATVNITVNQPSSSVYSQSGIKYVRSSGVIKYQIEFVYPILTEEQFAPILSTVEAARGQMRPFLLPLRFITETKDYGLLFQKPNDTATEQYKVKVVSTDATDPSLITLEGFNSYTTEALIKGQHVSIGLDTVSNNNGSLHTIIADNSSNIYGETKAKLSYPPKTALIPGTDVILQPKWAVATLAADAFEFQKTLSGHFVCKALFMLDEFK
jgi:hypothetical protein